MFMIIGWILKYVSLKISSTSTFVLCLRPTASAFDYETYTNRFVEAGQSVVLPCQSSLNVSVDWWYMKASDASQVYVYSNFIVYENYHRKISKELVDPAKRDFSLILLNAHGNDSGWYVCIEDGGIGKRHVVAVNVTG